MLTGKTTLIGLAKNEEELFFPGDKESVKLPYNSESLKLIRRIRDEVHRFGITFHRKKRSKGTFKNELEDIPGIGKATADHFIKRIQIGKKYSGNKSGRNRKIDWKIKGYDLLRIFFKLKKVRVNSSSKKNGARIEIQPRF